MQLCGRTDPHPFGSGSALVNALQRRATVVVQKSIREGFGLTVAEAMWKGTPVIGGNVGGIRHQIRDGENGFLVDSVEQVAARIVRFIKDPKLRHELGRNAHQTVRERFLLTRLAEQWLEPIYSVHSKRSFPLRGQIANWRCEGKGARLSSLE